MIITIIIIGVSSLFPLCHGHLLAQFLIRQHVVFDVDVFVTDLSVVECYPDGRHTERRNGGGNGRSGNNHCKRIVVRFARVRSNATKTTKPRSPRVNRLPHSPGPRLYYRYIILERKLLPPSCHERITAVLPDGPGTITLDLVQWNLECQADVQHGQRAVVPQII